MLAPHRSVIVVATILVSVSACRKKPEPAPVPTPVVTPRVNQDSIDAARRAADEAARRAAADAEAAKAAEARRAAAALEAVRNTIAAQVYFDFDKDNIRDDQSGVLDAKVPILSANAGVRIRVAGHTDNRGSDEYNLALGQRRAASAKRYLVSHGVAESRIETVSFGEERAVAQGENEEAWSKNRRDEFEIIAGGESLKAPR